MPLAPRLPRGCHLWAGAKGLGLGSKEQACCHVLPHTSASLRQARHEGCSSMYSWTGVGSYVSQPFCCSFGCCWRQ